MNNTEDKLAGTIVSLVLLLLFIILFTTPWTNCISPYHVAKCSNFCESKGMSFSETADKSGGWECFCKFRCTKETQAWPMCY